MFGLRERILATRARKKMKPQFVIDHIEKLRKLLDLKDLDIFVRSFNSRKDAEVLTTANIRWVEYEDGAVFIVKSGIDTIARFSMLQLPGCCGICMTTGESVSPGYRSKGVGTILGGLRKQIAKYCGYTVLLCTDVVANEPQKKVLVRHGWIDVFRFRNRRTSNLVDVSVVSLDPSYETTHLFSQQGDISCPTLSRPQWKPAVFNRRTN